MSAISSAGSIAGQSPLNWAVIRAFLPHSSPARGAVDCLNFAGDRAEVSAVIRLRPPGRMVFCAAVGVNRGRVVATIGQFRMPIIVIVVI